MRPEKKARRGGGLYPTYFALGIAGYPIVSFLPELLGASSRSVTVPFRGLYLLLGLIIFLRAGRYSRLYQGPGWYLFGGFWLAYMARLLADIVYFPVDLRLPGAEYFLYAIGVTLIPTLAFFVRISPAIARKSFLWTVGGMALASAGAAIYNLRAIGSSFVRVYGNEALSPITLGHIGVSLVLLVGYALLTPEMRSRRWLVSAMALVPLGILCLALSASRGPLLALVLCIGLLTVMLLKRGRGIRLAVLGIIVSVAVPMAVRQSIEIGSGLIARLSSTSERIEYNRERRLVLWRDALSQFAENPVTGSGLEERNTRFYPHNVIIESFMATGLIGGALFTVFLGLGLVSSWKLLMRSPLYGWIGLLHFQHVTWAMLSGAIYARPEMWYMSAMAISAWYTCRAYGRTHQSVPVRTPVWPKYVAATQTM